MGRYDIGEIIWGYDPMGRWGHIGMVGETGPYLTYPEWLDEEQATDLTAQLKEWERKAWESGEYPYEFEPPRFAPEAITFSPEEVLEETGFEMPEGWSIFYPEPSPSYFVRQPWLPSISDPRLVSPTGKKFAFEDVFVTKEGTWITKAEKEELDREAGLWGQPSEEMESIWAEFGGYPAGYQAPVDYERIQGLIKTLLPGRATGILVDDLEAVRMYIAQDVEGFWEDIQDIGWTEDTEALLKAIPFERPINEADLQDIFGIERAMGAITLEGDYIEESWIKDTWDAFNLGARELLHKSAQYFVSTLPNMMFPDVEVGQRRTIQVLPFTTPEWGAPYSPEEVARTNQFNQSMRDKFRKIYSENKVKNEEWLVKHPELQPKPEYKQDVTKHPELLKDPGYWAYTIAEAASFSLGVLGTTLGVTFATKNPYLGLLAGTAVATPAQSQDLYEDLLASGAPEDKAASIAVPIGMVIALVESITNLPLLKAISPAFNLLKRNIQQTVIKQTMAGLFKKGVKTFATIEAVEAMEEVTQGAIHNAFVKTYDEDREIFENVDETIIKTLIATSPFAIFGGGMSMRHVSSDVARTIPEMQKKAENWEQDTLTGEWYKPEKMVDIHEEHFNKLQEAGLVEEQARLKALNEVARTPEGEKAISEAAKKIEKGVPLVRVPPVVEAPAATELRTLHTHPARAKGIRNVTETEVRDYLNRVKELASKEAPREVPNMNEAIRAFEAGDLGAAGVAADTTLSKIHKLYKTHHPEFELARPPVAVPVTPEVTYDKALEEFRKASREFRLVREDYRAKKIGDTEFLKGKAIFDEASEVADAAETTYIKAKAIPEAVLRITEAEEVMGRLYEMEAEVAGLKEWLTTEPATRLISLIKKTGWYKGEVSNLTIAQYKKLTGKTPLASILTKDGKHVRWEYALDDVATEMGYKSGEELKEAIERAGETLTKFKDLEAEIRATEVPALPSLPEPTAEEVATNLAITGSPTLTPAQITRTLDLFGKYITDPSALNAWELTRELRRETLAGRAENLKARAQELIVSENLPVEEAMNQAIKETMSGELPLARTDYLDDLTSSMRDALFNKVYQTLKAEPFEMMSTTEALTNALLGKPIPREPGVRGGSAYTRLQRVFGEQPQVFEAIKIGAREGKPLEDIVVGIYHEIGRPPIPVDEKTADYLRAIGKKVKTTEDLLAIKAYKEVHPPTFEAPIKDAFKVKPLFNFMEQSMLNRVLKELLWLPLDIGNLLRANKASFDNSFLRQSKALAGGHPVVGFQAHTTAWQCMLSQKHTEAEWELITRDPDFQIYDQIRQETGHDPLRVPAFAGVKGTEQWRTAEEFGFPTVERLIPRLTQKVPYIKYSERAFSAGTNKIVWGVWKQKLKWSMRYSEKIASGQVKLKEGEAFSIVQEMTDHQAMLGDMIQRANLRRFSGLAPAMNAFFFAARSKIGRFLAPTHLIGVTIRQGKVSFNPRIIKEAWRDFLLTNAEIAGVMFLGSWLGLWELEDDPRNAEFMSARIGNTRIDPWAGQRQFVVLYTRLVTKTGVSSVTGAEYDVNPQGAVLSFITNSLSPLAAAMLEFYTGRNFIGGVIDFADAKYWIEKITPFAINDVWEAAEEDWRMGVAVTIPAIYGEGVQTYTGDWVENWPKMGLPKYLENTAYGLTEPVYDVKDFWADTAGQFKGVDPAILTKEKGFPAYIRAIVEARIIKEHLSTLPNQELTSLNADPAEGITFGQYYQMWRDREKLVLEGDEEKLKEFDADERTRNAHLGNFSQRQFALLIEYHSITDKVKQAEFLEKHPELEVNPRLDWLKSHPKDNAQLAIWGQAKVLTQEAYDEAQRMIKELDIPDNAVGEYLPPEAIAKPYFELNEVSEEWGSNSWEAKLILAKNPELAEWLGREIPDTPVRSLELKIKHRDATDLEKQYSDSKDPLYIEDAEERQEKLKEILGEKKYQEWVDDYRRIEAIEHEASDIIIEDWVDRGKVVDEFSGGSSEAKVWLIDHPEVHKWALDQELLTDDGSDWNVPVLRINAKWREDDDWYDNGIPDKHKNIENKYARDAAIAQERKDYLLSNQEYYKDRYRRDAYGIVGPAPGYEKFPEDMIETYVDYYTNPDLKRSDEYYEKDARYEALSKTGRAAFLKANPEYAAARNNWYEDDWYKQEHPEFTKEMVALGIWERPDFRKTPTREEYKLYVKYLSLDEGYERKLFRWNNKDLDDWLLRAGKVTTPVTEEPTPPEEKEAKERRKSWYEQMEEQGLLEEWMEKFK